MKYQWKLYFNKHKGRKPKQQLLDALQYVKNKELALDLGCGLMIESEAMIKNGFKKIIAIDNSNEIKNFIIPNKKIQFILSDFKNLKLNSESFDLINAEFALPFYGKDGFDKFFTDIKNSLKKDGIFTGQLFGTKDSWNKLNSKIIFHKKEEVLSLLQDFEILFFLEEHKEGSSASEEFKVWHIFRFIARKK